MIKLLLLTVILILIVMPLACLIIELITGITEFYLKIIKKIMSKFSWGNLGKYD